MTRARLLALFGAFLATAAAAQRYGIVEGPLFDVAFTPEKNFKGELVAGSDDQLLLTAVYAMRDGDYPVYSLAVAHTVRCRQKDGASKCANHYPIRMVRVGGGGDPDSDFRASRVLLGRLKEADAASAAEVRRTLREKDLLWLETDLLVCPGAYEKFDPIRRADWSPDLHHKFVDTSSGREMEIIMHPAMMKISMSGLYVTARYAGHIFRQLPQNVQSLVDTLEPCWKPAGSQPPWRR